MQKIKLNEIKVGEKWIIKNIIMPENTKRRLQDLGFVKGSIIECVLKSPLKDPTAYRIRGTVIAIREDVSKNIFVERI